MGVVVVVIQARRECSSGPPAVAIARTPALLEQGAVKPARTVRAPARRMQPVQTALFGWPRARWRRPVGSKIVPSSTASASTTAQ